MTTRHLVDPELLPGIDLIPNFSYSREALAVTRRQYNELITSTLSPPVEDLFSREYFVPRAPGTPPLRILVYMPKGPSRHRAALLHVHGGGYVMGRPEDAEGRNRDLCRSLDCVVISVDYRLPPEHPYPAPVEDCYAALKWLHADAGFLSIDKSRIAIYGESAGGGLAAALALLTRDRGEVSLIYQMLIYPMLDDRTCVQAGSPLTGEFIWTRAANVFGWTSLLGGAPGAPYISPYAAPARAVDLAGLPPSCITVGALDLFQEEDIAYARRLMAAGVSTELHVYPGAYHGFDLCSEARVARQMERDIHAALHRALCG